MAIAGNDSKKEIVKEIPLWTGIVEVKVDAVCPTLEEAHKLGYTYIQNEPTYISVKDEVKQVRIDFFVSSPKMPDFKTKISIFLADEHRISKTGKEQFINKFATTSWGNGVQECIDKVAKSGKKWFLPDGARNCHPGEEQLYKLLQNWLNVKVGDVLQLDHFKKLFDGDFTELKSLHKTYSNNIFKVLAEVSQSADGKYYQQVNNSIFDRATAKLPTAFITYINEQKASGNPLKNHFSIEWKPFIPTYNQSTPDADLTKGAPASDFVF